MHAREEDVAAVGRDVGCQLIVAGIDALQGLHRAQERRGGSSDDVRPVLFHRDPVHPHPALLPQHDRHALRPQPTVRLRLHDLAIEAVLQQVAPLRHLQLVATLAPAHGIALPFHLFLFSLGKVLHAIAVGLHIE